MVWPSGPIPLEVFLLRGFVDVWSGRKKVKRFEVGYQIAYVCTHHPWCLFHVWWL